MPTQPSEQEWSEKQAQGNCPDCKSKTTSLLYIVDETRKGGYVCLDCGKEFEQ